MPMQPRWPAGRLTRALAFSSNFLREVTAVAASNVWAVGGYSTGTDTHNVLILRWNGHAWQRIAMPNSATDSGLEAVAASSASNLWAVGIAGTPATRQALPIHCC
jgi:hypothetical protein